MEEARIEEHVEIRFSIVSLKFGVIFQNLKYVASCVREDIVRMSHASYFLVGKMKKK